MYVSKLSHTPRSNKRGFLMMGFSGESSLILLLLATWVFSIGAENNRTSGPSSSPTPLPTPATTPLPSPPIAPYTDFGDLGWCFGAADFYIGQKKDADACWEACAQKFGEELVAIDWWKDGFRVIFTLEIMTLSALTPAHSPGSPGVRPRPPPPL